MAGWRALRNRTREVAHRTFEVPALYILDRDDLEEHPPVPCLVRVHTVIDTVGKVKGTNFEFSEKHEPIPQIIFRRSEVPLPKRNAIVSIAAGEAYSIDNILRNEETMITAQVVILGALDADGLPLPEA